MTTRQFQSYKHNLKTENPLAVRKIMFSRNSRFCSFIKIFYDGIVIDDTLINSIQKY